MALTQAQWYDKLKSFVPDWFFADEVYSKAVFNAIAKIIRDQELLLEEYLEQTFIIDADGDYLDLHGSERDIARVPSELDASYSERIRYIQNSIALNTLEPALNAVLNNGEAIFIENWAYGFADDDLFCDVEESRYLSKTKQYNRFTVVTPVQTGGDQNVIKELIVQVLDENKALGVFYDVVYLT